MKETANIELYNQSYYEVMRDKNPEIADVMMPIILNVLNPHSIVDFGCGIGAFLVEAVIRGIEVLGIDGDYINRDDLLFPDKYFYPFDLSEEMNINKKYDLAMSLEVAEHISEEYADVFVSNIVQSADIIIFSAAIPRQNGTGHINLKPTSYWCNKFEKYGYSPSNCLREIFWNSNIQSLRRQNIILLAKTNLIKDIEQQFLKYRDGMLIDIVHPCFFDEKIAELEKKYEKEIEKQKEKYNFVISAIDGKKLAKECSSFSLFEFVDTIQEIDNWINIEGFQSNISCRQLEDKEKEINNNEYLIWGVGDDGKKIIKILSLLRKKINIIVDNEKKGEIIDGYDIIDIEHAKKVWRGEIIVLASRKYRYEMESKIDNNMKKYIL